MTDRLWATMSCISRAIRARSAPAASWPCWSRSCSSRTARSSREASSARRLRTLMPITPAAVAKAESATNALSSVVVAAPAQGGEHDADLEHERGEHGGPDRLRDGDGVERDQQRAVAEGPHVGQPLGEGDRRDRREGLDRPPPAREQRQREHQRPHHARQDVGVVRAAQRQRDDARDQRDVDEPRRPRAQGSQARRHDIQAGRHRVHGSPRAIRRRGAGARSPRRRPRARRSRRRRAKPPHGERWWESSNTLVATVKPALSGR